MIEQPASRANHARHAEPQAVPRLEGRGLTIARIAWVALALLLAAIFFTSLPAYGQTLGGQLAHISDQNQNWVTAVIAALSGLASLATALLSFALALLFFRRRFTESVAAGLSFYLLLYAVIMAGPLEHWSSYWLDDQSLALRLQAGLIGVPTIGLLTLFPSGRFVPSWSRWLLPLTIPWAVILLMLPTQDPAIFSSANSTIIMALTAGLIGMYAAGFYAQYRRYRYFSKPMERQQTKWVVYGLALWLIYMLVSSIPYYFLESLPPEAPVPWWGAISVLGWFLSLSIVPVCLTIAVTRYRLWDIDILINRTLVYGVLTAVGIGFYLLIVVLAGIVFQQSSNLANLILTGILIVTLLPPLRSRLQRGADRLVPAMGEPEVSGAAGPLHDPLLLLPRSKPAATIHPPAGNAPLTLVLGGLALAIALAGLIFLVLNLSTPKPERWGFWGLQSLYAVLVTCTGIFIARRQPQNPIGWLILFAGLFGALTGFSEEYSVYALLTRAVTWSGGVTVAGLGHWLWVPAYGLLAIFVPLLFPDGRFQSARWRLLAGLGALWIVLASVWIILFPGPLENNGAINNPFGLEGLDVGWLGNTSQSQVILIPGLILMLGAAASLISRYRSAGEETRAQLKWLAFAAALMPVAGVIGQFNGLLPDVILFAIMTAVPLSIAVAIVRYRLYDIDLLINRTLVYGVLTAVIVGLYALVVGGAGILFQQPGNLTGLLLTAVLVLALFRPLRALVQRGADRVVRVGSLPALAAPAPETGALTSQREHEPIPAVFPLSGRRRLLARTIWWMLALLIPTLTTWSIVGQPLTYRDLPFNVFMPAGFFVIATVIFWRKSDDGMAILTSLMLIFLGPYLLTGANGFVEMQTGWRIINRLLVGISVSTFLLFLALFPDGRIAPRWIRPGLLTTVIAIFVVVFAVPDLNANADFWIYLLVFPTIVGLLAQIYRYRRVFTPSQRQQTKWILAGMAGPVLTGSWWFLIIVPGLVAIPQNPAGYLLHQLFFAALALFLPLSIAFSIFRYRLWDIDLLINRALVYGALTACVVAVYALVVGAMGTLFQTQGNWLVALLATGLVAVLFQPLRERWQGWVNQTLYGRRDEPFEVLASLGQRLENTMSPETVNPIIVETVAQTLKLPYVAIAVETEGVMRTIESSGVPTTQPERFPLTYQGVVIGELLVARRSPDEPFAEAEKRLLHNIARQAGTAVHAIQLTRDLQQARQQIVTSREEERRRLRRDLHDGLGPSLAAQLLKIGSARALLAERPQFTDNLLAEMEKDIENTLAEVRRIVYDLRPPALDQWGLLGALRAYAESCAAGAEGDKEPRLTVRVDAPAHLPPLPAAVEVAAYYIAREGLTNVVRHAQADHCRLQIQVDGGEQSHLRLTIRDDGRGLPGVVHAGVGLTAMRERAAELGGSWSIGGDRRGGTVVTAVLPLNIGPQTEGQQVEV